MDFYQTLLKEGKTQFHVVKLCRQKLEEHGFQDISLLNLSQLTDLEPGKYYLSPFPSLLIPFIKGNVTRRVHIAAAHTDFPMLKLKSNPELLKQGYAMANVEPYGGFIKETWFDRPLGIAGKVISKSQDIYAPNVYLFDSQKPVCIIPNLAPHLKRSQKVEELDVQKELIPVFSLEQELDEEHKNSYLTDYLASELSLNKEDILDYDLYLYIVQEPLTVGLHSDFVTSPRIDNISSVAAIIEAMCTAETSDTLIVGALFDNEEIGSRSKQGADSNLLANLVNALAPDVNLSRDGFYLSIDVAHATHPNYPEKSDPTNRVLLGNGVVLKSSASQRYVGDSEAAGVFIQLCEAHQIRYQKAVNRSGMPGGQTLGSIMASYLPMRACDVGIPVLAMHSASELSCRKDYTELQKLVVAFYRN